MSYLGNAPESVFTEMKYQDLTGGSGTSFTLNQAVSNPQEIEVFVNNVRQEPSAAYSVSGTTLTMTESVGASEDFYVVFQGMAQGSATHPATQSLEAAAGTFTGDVAIDSNGGFLFDVSDKALEFGDNYKAVFGAGGDLEIYHTGSATLMEDKGTGPFVLRTNGNVIQLDTQFGSEVMGKFIKDGAVELYHDNSKKFETTSAGVTVTGDITVSGNDISTAASMLLKPGGTEIVNINNTGDVIVKGQGSNRAMLTLRAGSNTANSQLRFGDQAADTAGRIMYDHSDDTMRFQTNGSERFRVSGSGIHIGGTGTANALDDYEEGTATVTLNGGSGHPVSRLQTTAYYTKIGSIVNVNFEFNNVNTASYSGYISVFGLPFAASSPAGVTRQVCGQIGFYGIGTFDGDGGIFGRLGEGGTEILLWNNRSNNSWGQVTHNAGSNRYLIMNITYRTDS